MQKLVMAFMVMSLSLHASAQEADGDQLGAWYMYFFNMSFGDSGFGIRGDSQYRFWNFGSDLEQIGRRPQTKFSANRSNYAFALHQHCIFCEIRHGVATLKQMDSDACNNHR